MSLALGDKRHCLSTDCTWARYFKV